MNVGRKPQRRAAVTFNVIGALVCECLTSERLNELTRMLQILMRIRPSPPGAGIRAKRKHQDINHTGFVGFSRGLNNGHCHFTPELVVHRAALEFSRGHSCFQPFLSSILSTCRLPSVRRRKALPKSTTIPMES